MLVFKNTTQTPNKLFDVYLKTLNKSELKVLLVIIRRIVGFISPHNQKKRVKWTWISQSLFMAYTGLSNRSISSAITSLINKKMIEVRDEKGYLVYQNYERRASARLYFSCNLLLEKNKKIKVNEDAGNNRVKKLHTIKQTMNQQYYEKIAQGTQKLSDKERLQQIIFQKRNLEK